jgi:hypothetical protein
MKAIGRVLICALVATGVAGGAMAQARAEPVRGDVVQRQGNVLQVKATTGEIVSIEVPDSLRVNIHEKASLDALRKDAFVATTAAPGPDGTLVASEVRIFPESMRGLGEGHRPMATPPGSTMTNATVASVASTRSRSNDTMTNATVAGVADTGGVRSMRLVYAGGETTVLIPATTLVVTLERGDLSSLAPGAHVNVYVAAAPSGLATAQRISVGKNGSGPPI